MHALTRWPRVVVPAVLITFGGCDSSTTDLVIQDVVGSYRAVVFELDGASAIGAGAGMTLELRSDFTTAGQLFIPASLGGPLDADMSGTFSLDPDGSIVIEQPADTFVRDAEWTWRDGAILGSWSSSSATIAVRLER